MPRLVGRPSGMTPSASAGTPSERELIGCPLWSIVPGRVFRFACPVSRNSFFSMIHTKYKLSFTAASLALSESKKIAEAYLRCKDWNLTKRTIKQTNLLQSRTNSRTTRISIELIQRLGSLTDEQLTLLVEGNLSEQKYLLWFAICKTYPFIREFATEVLHERFMSRTLQITGLDYDAFYKRKADWHEELDKITTSTRGKIRQVLFLIMRQADLISEVNIIHPAVLSARLIAVLKPDAPMSFQIFPIPPSDFEG